MARLHKINNNTVSDTKDDDNSLPELSSILRSLEISTPYNEPLPMQGKKCTASNQIQHKLKSHPATLDNNSKPESTSFALINEKEIRSSPRRKANAPTNYSKFALRLSEGSAIISDEEEDSFTDLSGFIVPDSASDEDTKPSRSQKRQEHRDVGKRNRHNAIHASASSAESDGLESTGPIEPTSPRKTNDVLCKTCPESPPRPSVSSLELDGNETHSDLIDSLATLKLYLIP